MKVYLVMARDRDYDDFDRHVVACYSREAAADAVAKKFNDAIASAKAEQEASGRGRLLTGYESRLQATLRSLGDEAAWVADEPRYFVEAFDVDPELP